MAAPRSKRVLKELKSLDLISISLTGDDLKAFAEFKKVLKDTRENWLACTDQLEKVYHITNSFINQYQEQIEKYKNYLPFYLQNYIANFYYDRAIMSLALYSEKF